MQQHRLVVCSDRQNTCCPSPAGVNVLSVTRIHNRWLRNRFEKQVAEIGSSGDSTTWVKAQHSKYPLRSAFRGALLLRPSSLPIKASGLNKQGLACNDSTREGKVVAACFDNGENDRGGQLSDIAGYALS
eukprot:scaffold61587_cov13-Tisochrysis_lutea.AAC.1